MNTAVINIKTDPKVKKDAQNIASDLGFSLSAVMNGYLKSFIRTKAINFNLEEPSDYLIQALEESETDRKAGRVSPTFDNAENAIKWLNNSKRKYAGKIQ